MNRRAANSVEVETLAQAQSANEPSARVPAADRKSGSSRRSPSDEGHAGRPEDPRRVRAAVGAARPDHGVAPSPPGRSCRVCGFEGSRDGVGEALGQAFEQRIRRRVLREDARVRSPEPRRERLGHGLDRRHHPDPGRTAAAGPEPGQAHHRQIRVQVCGIAVDTGRDDHAHVARVSTDRVEVVRTLLQVEFLDLDRRGVRILQRGGLERQPHGLQRRERVLVGVGDGQVPDERDLDHRGGRHRSAGRCRRRRLAGREQRREDHRGRQCSDRRGLPSRTGRRYLRPRSPQPVGGDERHPRYEVNRLLSCRVPQRRRVDLRSGRGDGTGRHGGLKSHCARARAGSNPAPGT